MKLVFFSAYFFEITIFCWTKMESMQHPSAGPIGSLQVGNRGPESTSYDPLIGKKVWTRWPDDNNFYEAVITDYNPDEVISLFYVVIHVENITLS